MGKKSKYKLDPFRLLKVPMNVFEKYKTAYGIEAWAEAARDVLDMATAALPMKGDNEDG